ncbi:MAG: SsrA-binding protein [Acidimicrobiales bacterium]|nr:MAG: SsrA-binding protein [Acidimicrobiales bacterium]
MTPRDGSQIQVVATNRRARHDYDILETLECGLVLRGSEVKSLREARVNLADSYARVKGDELWMVGVHISPYTHQSDHVKLDPMRDRKLLAHRHEIDRLRARVEQSGLTLVPLRIYFKDGKAKVEIAVARGRRKYDKRQAIAKRDAQREAEREVRRGRVDV